MSRGMRVDLLVCTPKEEEFSALTGWLEGEREWQDPLTGNAYRLGTVHGASGAIQVGVLCSGKGILQTQTWVGEGVDALSPRVVVLFGTAAGLKATTVGDVLVGSEGRYYEQGKITPDGFQGHPVTRYSSHRLVERAKILGRQEAAWRGYLTNDMELPGFFTGAIACGDKVIKDDNAPLVSLLKEQHADAIGCEMEAYPFLLVASRKQGVEAIIIRGVSDHFGDKDIRNKEGSKEVALRQAATFLRYYVEAPGLLAEQEARRYRLLPWVVAVLMVITASLLYPFLAPAIAPEPPQEHSGTDLSASPPVAVSTRSGGDTALAQKGVESTTQDQRPAGGNRPSIAKRASPSPNAPLTVDQSEPERPINADSIASTAPLPPVVSSTSQTDQTDSVISQDIVPAPPLNEAIVWLTSPEGRPLTPGTVNVNGDLYRVNSKGVVLLPVGACTLFYDHNGKQYEFKFIVQEGQANNVNVFDLY